MAFTKQETDTALMALRRKWPRAAEFNAGEGAFTAKPSETFKPTEHFFSVCQKVIKHATGKDGHVTLQF